MMKKTPNVRLSVTNNTKVEASRFQHRLRKVEDLEERMKELQYSRKKAFHETVIKNTDIRDSYVKLGYEKNEEAEASLRYNRRNSNIILSNKVSLTPKLRPLSPFSKSIIVSFFDLSKRNQGKPKCLDFFKDRAFVYQAKAWLESKE